VTPEEFAEALAAALGPLYRVSIVDPAGRVEASFGEFTAVRTSRTEIPLPRGSKILRLEFDVDALVAAQRLVNALAPGEAAAARPAARFTHVDTAIHELISMAEAQLRVPIAQMTRRQKQQVVRFLDEHGAFNLRKSVETVADVLGVSRFTVYNYLEFSRGS
jgi:HTH domain